MQFNDSFYYWRKNTQGKNREKSFWEIDESEAEETTFEWILRFFCFLGRKVSIKVFDFMFLIFDYFSAFGLEGHHCQRVKKLHWTIPATTTKQNEILKMINFFFLFFVIEYKQTPFSKFWRVTTFPARFKIKKVTISEKF